jgi:hypothetical protein
MSRCHEVTLYFWPLPASHFLRVIGASWSWLRLPLAFEARISEYVYARKFGQHKRICFVEVGGVEHRCTPSGYLSAR